jgi:hypothetical protein
MVYTSPAATISARSRPAARCTRSTRSRRPHGNRNLEGNGRFDYTVAFYNGFSFSQPTQSPGGDLHVHGLPALRERAVVLQNQIYVCS